MNRLMNCLFDSASVAINLRQLQLVIGSDGHARGGSNRDCTVDMMRVFVNELGDLDPSERRRYKRP